MGGWGRCLGAARWATAPGPSPHILVVHEATDAPADFWEFLRGTAAGGVATVPIAQRPRRGLGRLTGS